jgi:hypothetical protein
MPPSSVKFLRPVPIASDGASRTNRIWKTGDVDESAASADDAKIHSIRVTMRFLIMSKRGSSCCNCRRPFSSFWPIKQHSHRGN